MPDANVFNVPLSVTVVFPRADFQSVNTCVRLNSGIGVENYWPVIVLGTGHAGTQLIHSTAIANFNGEENPVNVTELQTLAARIAADWYAWRKSSLERRLLRAIAWPADGMHDVEINHEVEVSTVVHRSEWEPEFGQLKHAGQFGSSDEPPIVGVQGVRLVTGVLKNRTFDAQILLRNNESRSDTDHLPVWVYDWAAADALVKDSRYNAVFRGVEPGGPYFMSLVDDNLDNPLDDTNSWVELVTVPGEQQEWGDDEYPAGSLVTYGDVIWVANVDTLEEPGDGDEWTEVVPSDQAGYSDLISYDTGAYVQEVRAVYSIRSLGPLEEVCLKNCEGVEYCFQWPKDMVTIGPCEPASGPQTGCGGCSSTRETYCTSFPGVQAADCTGCEALASIITLTREGEEVDCTWTFSFTDDAICDDDVTIQLAITDAQATITVYVGEEAVAVYQSDEFSQWDCESEVVLTLVGDPSEEFCTNWPETITLGPCGGGVTGCMDCGIPSPFDAYISSPLLGAFTAEMTLLPLFDPAGLHWSGTGTSALGTATVKVDCYNNANILNVSVSVKNTPPVLSCFASGTAEIVSCDPFCAIGTLTTPGPCGPVSVVLGDCSGFGAHPTVDFNSDDICQTDTVFAIEGTNFDEFNPTANLVTFNLGAVGVVTVATSTTLSGNFTILPKTFGALTAIVTNGNGSSAPAMQIATVIDCSDLSCTGTTWCDSFTDSDSTAIGSHTPEVSPGGASYTVSTGAFVVYNNRCVLSSGPVGVFTFDPGVTEYTWTIDFLISPSSQSSNSREFRAKFRVNGLDEFTVRVQMAASADTASGFTLYKIVSGVQTALATGTVTINTDTHYTCTIVVTSSTVAATINGVTVNVTDSDLNTNTDMSVVVIDFASSLFRPYVDNIRVIEAGSGTGWEDSFTGSDGTAMTAHTGENTPGGYAVLVTNGKLHGGRGVLSAPGSMGAAFDPGLTSYTATVKFKIRATGGESGVRMFRIIIRDTKANISTGSGIYIQVQMGVGVTTTDRFFIIAGGTTTVLGATINQDTEYTATVIVTPTTIQAIIGGADSGSISNSTNGSTTGLGFLLQDDAGTNSAPYVDDLEVS